jgi:RNA-directed DNA polymerase
VPNWLVPPTGNALSFPGTRCVPCNTRSTGRGKADPGRRFHTLMDKVLRGDVGWRGWVAVRRNDGAPGIDKLTVDAVEEYGIVWFLAEIQSELREGRYRPLPARQVLIPKPGQPGQTRPLAIASVRDRVVQAAVKIVFEPIFEADFLPCSFGFRPRRSAHDALPRPR